MKPFRTLVTVDKPPFTLTHADKMISVGSCFSENIGRKFQAYKFSININPFGQQYNPYSVARALNRLMEPVPYTESDLVFHDELYHSFDHHGSFSRHSTRETLEVINNNLATAANDLRHANVLFLTFGTAHVFSRRDNNAIVSNCHKLSGTQFNRFLMSPAQIEDMLYTTLGRMQQHNPALRVVLTVSPVRYFAFGHHENSVSKAHLFTALHALQQRQPDYYYFPAYELVMDDLRDYRFFAEDMLHPNYQATDYVWEQLCSTMLDKKTQEVMKEIDEILLAARHRPRNPNSEAHKKFVKKNIEKIEKLKQTHQLDFTDEFQILSQQLVQI